MSPVYERLVTLHCKNVTVNWVYLDVDPSENFPVRITTSGILARLLSFVIIENYCREASNDIISYPLC